MGKAFTKKDLINRGAQASDLEFSSKSFDM
jgi:hypothetical protein